MFQTVFKCQLVATRALSFLKFYTGDVKRNKNKTMDKKKAYYFLLE